MKRRREYTKVQYFDTKINRYVEARIDKEGKQCGMKILPDPLDPFKHIARPDCV